MSGKAFKFLPLICLFALCSCTIDERYSAESIKECLENAEISLFEKGIVIPIGDTEKMRMDSILTVAGLIKDDGLFQINENGELVYHMHSSIGLEDLTGDFDLEEVLEVKNFSVESSFTSSISSASTKASTGAPIAVLINNEVDFNSFKDVKIADNILSIGKVFFAKPDMQVKLELSGLPFVEGSGYQIDATITLPSFISPGTVKAQGTLSQKPDGSATFTCTNVPLESADFTGISLNDLKIGKGMSAKVKIEGVISTKMTDIDPSCIGKSITGKIITKVGGSEEDNIVITSGQAKMSYSNIFTFNHSLGEAEEIADALKDGKLSYNCALPEVELTTTISANTAVPMSLEAKVFEMKKGVVNRSKPLYQGSFEVPYCPDGVLRTTKSSDKFDFNPIINNLDDYLAIDISATVDPNRYCELSNSSELTLTAELDANIPYSFGKETYIYYRDTIFLSKEEEKEPEAVLETVAGTTVGFEADVYNGLPVSLDIGIIPLDGKVPIPLKEPCKFTLKANRESKMRCVFSPDENVLGMHMTAIVAEARLDGSEKVLRGDDYMQLKNIFLFLPQGVEFDIKDFRSNE